MKITLERSQIKEAMAGLGRIVANKTMLPVLSCIKLDVNEAVTMTATDLDQTARYTFTAGDATGTGVLIIPFQSLKDLAKGHDRELIEIEADNSETAIVLNHVGNLAVKKTVYGTPVDEWPVSPELPDTNPAEGFLETFRKLVPFASSDSTRIMLNGICVDVNGKGERPITMVATDGRRLTSCNSMLLPIELTTIIPVSRFLGWPGLQSEMQEIGIKTETVKVKEGRKQTEHKEVRGFGLKAGPWTYVCRTIDGSYPNWRQVIPDLEYCKNNRVVFTEDDANALRKILPTFSGHDFDTSSITFKTGQGGTVRIVGRGREDKVESTLDLQGGSRFEGQGRTCLNREYFLDALNAGFRSFQFSDECSPVRGDDGRGGTHVLMPMRFDDSPTVAPEQPVAESEVVPPVAAETPVPQTTPEPETTVTEPLSEPVTEQKKGPVMPDKKENQTPEPSTLDKAVQAVEVARAKIRETASALVDVADALKAAAKEGKTQATDLEKARTTLQKLQAISL